MTQDQLRAERRRLEDAYRDAYTALDQHFMLYGNVDEHDPDNGPYVRDDEESDFTANHEGIINPFDGA